VTVALAGDGGDEIFLGYPRYTGAALRGHYARVPEPLRRLAAERLAPLIRESRKGRHVYRRAREFLSEGAQPVERMYENWVGYFGADDLRAVVAPDLWRPDDATEGDVLAFVSRLVAEDDSPDLVDRVNHADIASFLPNNLLHYTDRMSMAHSLEVRVPYCDHVLAELLLRLPASQKMSLRESKRLMRKAVAGLLPPEILKRPKLGFNPPMGIWLAGALRGLMEEKLADTRLRAQGIFRPEPVRRMMEDHLAGRRDLSLHLWAMLVLQTWLDVYQP
jgi:asparagine synthase (glutamine-hydrolysing)